MEKTIQSGQGQKVQPNDQGSSGDGVQDNNQTQWQKEVGGRVYTNPDDLAEDYNKLQAEFTKRNQQNKKVSENEGSVDLDTQLDEVADLLDSRLASRGYVKKDDVKLQSIIALNPDLAGKEMEIRELANLPSNKGIAYEDIISKYNLKSSDKLIKAKSSSSEVVSAPNPKAPAEPKSIADLDPLSPEYEEWRKANFKKVRY